LSSGVSRSVRVSNDPPVLQGVNVKDQPIEWHPEHGSCSEFLLIMLHWQAVCGGMAFTAGADIPPMTLSRIRASWALVGEMGGMLAFARDGGAACVIGEGEALQLFVAGRTEHDFNLIDGELARMDVKLERAWAVLLASWPDVCRKTDANALPQASFRKHTLLPCSRQKVTQLYHSVGPMLRNRGSYGPCSRPPPTCCSRWAFLQRWRLG
jgi:hypothetical protein